MINLFGDNSFGNTANKVLNGYFGGNAFGVDSWNTNNAKDRQFEEDTLSGMDQKDITPIMGQVPKVDPNGGIQDRQLGFIAPDFTGQIPLQNQVQNHGIMGIIAGLI